MSVRPVGSAPKSSGSISQVRRKTEAPSGVDASFAELSSAPVEAARPAAAGQREPAGGGAAADGGALSNIAAAYLIFGGGSAGKDA